MGRLELFFDIALYGYLLATVAYAAWFFWRNRWLWLAGSGLLGLGFLSQAAFLVGRTVVAGRPPLANTFETLVFFAACVAAFFLVTVKIYGWKPMAPLAALASLFVTLIAYLLMQDEIEPLMPALRNNFWLTVHVVFCFVSYAAFLLAYLAALASLLKSDRYKRWAVLAIALNVSGFLAALVVVAASGRGSWREARAAILLGAAGGAVVAAIGLWPLLGWLVSRLRLRERLPEMKQLEKVTYKTVALGFPFLTLGIVTGAYWANQAWGRYWGWDDKEVASLVTWLVFAVYLHLRLAPKWRGPWVAWIAVIGFWCVLFTYFGVNYLMRGLHSYV